MALTLRRAKASDGLSLFRDIRKADLEEWVMASGRPVLDCLVDASTYPDTWAVEDEGGDTLSLWGTMPSKTPDFGVAWMVCTNGCLLRVHEMHHFFKLGIAEMHGQYTHLEALSAHHNHAHHKWMVRMGFQRTGHTVANPLGFRFIHFHREKGA